MNTKVIMEYMRNNIDKNYKIEDIAKYFNYSKFEFSRKFKDITGFSASRFYSFLKIEKALSVLINENQKVIVSQILSGHKSSGTFSNLFNKYVGMTPTNYKKNMSTFYNITIEYINSVKKGEITDDTYFHNFYESINSNSKNSLVINFIYPENYKSELTFIGLFDTPQPENSLVIGKVIVPEKSENECIFTNIPNGKYYLLAYSIEKGCNAEKFFDLRDALRVMMKKPFIFPFESESKLTLTLRQARATDFPILINIPEIIFKLTNEKN